MTAGPWARALVTGATSGIGAALVEQLAPTAAAAGLRGLAEGKVRLVPGVYNKAASYLMPLVPAAVLRRIDGRFRTGNQTQTT